VTQQSQPSLYRVVFVCTGNICRSPFAERALRGAFQRLGADGRRDWPEDIEVASAGTVAMVGAPMDRGMAELADRHRIPADGHVARQLDRDLVASADLLLGLAREHRRDIVTTLPNASRRAFALQEFVRLAEDARDSGVLAFDPAATAPETMAALVEAAVSRRGFAPPPEDPADDDIPDPYGRPAEVYELSASAIVEAVRRLEDVLVDGPARAAG